MDLFAAVLAAEALDGGPVSPALEAARLPWHDHGRPDYMSVAVMAISDTLLAVFNLASAQGEEKRTAAYHPRRSLAGRAAKAGVGTILEWTSEDEDSRGRALVDIRSAQRYGIAHVICVVIPQLLDASQTDSTEACGKRALGVLTLGFRQQLCPDDRFKGDLLRLAGDLSRLLPPHIPAFLRDFMEFSTLLPAYTGQCLCCGGPLLPDEITGFMSCPCAASTNHPNPDQGPDSGAAPLLLSGPLASAEPDNIGANCVDRLVMPAAVASSNSFEEQSGKALGSGPAEAEPGGKTLGSESTEAEQGVPLASADLPAGGTSREEKGVNAHEERGKLGGNGSVLEDDPKQLLRQAAALERYKLDQKLGRFACQETEDEYCIAIAAYNLKRDYIMLGVHIAGLYITMLMPPFSIWQYDGAAACLAGLTLSILALLCSIPVYMKHRNIITSSFALAMRAYMVWAAALTLQQPGQRPLVARHFFSSVPIMWYLDGLFLMNCEGFRLPLVMLDVVGVCNALAAGYWFLSPLVGTAILLIACISVEALSYYSWKRSDRAARADFVSKRLGPTMMGGSPAWIRA